MNVDIEYICESIVFHLHYSICTNLANALPVATQILYSKTWLAHNLEINLWSIVFYLSVKDKLKTVISMTYETHFRLKSKEYSTEETEALPQCRLSPLFYKSF